jgi:hypothetical protein
MQLQRGIEDFTKAEGFYGLRKVILKNSFQPDQASSRGGSDRPAKVGREGFGRMVS